MKNIMIGAIGGIVIIYMALIGLSVYAGSIRENELKNCVADSCMQTLKKCYGSSNADACADVKERIRTRVSSDSELSITIDVCDMEKGILSVRAEETFTYPNGTKRTITEKKTAIMERKASEQKNVTICYMAGEQCYKEYSIFPGEELPVPKFPEDAKGWKIRGKEQLLGAGMKTPETDLLIDAVY